MTWIIAHWAEVGFAMMVLDRIATATPPDLKVWGVPIGKYDDQVEKVLKGSLSIVPGKRK